jgi:hypothetical protein
MNKSVGCYLVGYRKVDETWVSGHQDRPPGALDFRPLWSAISQPALAKVWTETGSQSSRKSARAVPS